VRASESWHCSSTPDGDGIGVPLITITQIVTAPRTYPSRKTSTFSIKAPPGISLGEEDGGEQHDHSQYQPEVSHALTL